MAEALTQEAVEILRQLVRINTVNPPGNERPAQEYLAGLLERAGLEVTLAGPDPERPNLVARLRGKADGPVLGLLSHVDTVGADPAGWRHDPWSGALDEGCVWGRGALDMKSQTAAEVVAACSLAREGWRPERGDLVVISVSDEEVDGTGAEWLTTQRPDLARCDYLLNEGAGELFAVGDARFYAVSVGEKGVFRFTLSTDGAAGHASLPMIADNALLKLGPLLEALAHGRPGWDMTPSVRELLAALGLVRRPGGGAGLAGRAGSRLRAGGGGDAAGDARSDDGRRIRRDERDPRAGAPARGLPGAAGARAGGGAGAGPRGDRDERLPAGLHRVRGRQRLGRARRRCSMRCRGGSSAPSRARTACRRSRSATRTRAPSAPPSPSAWRTGSSRTGT